jgi:hypothetical protein
MCGMWQRCGGYGVEQFDEMRKSETERFVGCVVMAFVYGSTITSPFLHTTTDFEVARKWYNDCHDHCGSEKYLVRIRRTSLPEDCIVDLSTRQHQDVARTTSSTCD